MLENKNLCGHCNHQYQQHTGNRCNNDANDGVSFLGCQCYKFIDQCGFCSHVQEEHYERTCNGSVSDGQSECGCYCNGFVRRTEEWEKLRNIEIEKNNQDWLQRNKPWWRKLFG